MKLQKLGSGKGSPQFQLIREKEELEGKGPSFFSCSGVSKLAE